MPMLRPPVLMLLCLLGGCGADPVPTDTVPLDPVMAEALQGQLMVDPDLTQQNLRNMAVMPGGPVDPALPLPDPAEPRAGS